VGLGLLGLFALLLFFVRPILWGGAGPAVPQRFAAAGASTAFVDVTQAAGFRHVHEKPVLDEALRPIMSWVASVGAAAAACDYDRDGQVDLYVTTSNRGRPNLLYRNRGDGTFVDVAAFAGVAAANDAGGVSTDCVWGDYDNDGLPDLYVVRWGHDLLYRNRGDGTFEDVTARAFRDESGHAGTPWTNGCAAVWFDHDGDGWLDLYIGNYFAPFDLWNLPHTRIMHDSFERSRNGGRNALYRNRGDGTFEDVAAQLGVDDCGWTLSVGHGDLDNDGWQDLYAANDFGPDRLFLNQGGRGFANVSAQALGEDTKKGMNVDMGDFDGDGWLDVYVTNITTAEYLQEGNMLWRNLGPGADGVPVFLDVALEAGVYDGGWGWGAKFWDYDNDGDLDLVSANGFITAGEGNYWYDLASWTVLGQDVTDALSWPPIGERSFSGRELVRLWRNDGQQRFSELAARAGLGDRHDKRGVVVFDMDNDGDLDLFLANQGGPPACYRNDAGGRGHWLALELRGRPPGSPADAIGARVTALCGGRMLVRELDGGNSYCGQSDRRVYLGLGDALRVDVLQVRWPSRRVQELRDVRADQWLALTEPAELPLVRSLVPQARAEDPGVLPAPEASRPELPAAEREALLTGLEQEVCRQAADVTLASRYRRECVRFAEHARAIDCFERLSAELPDVRNVRLQLSAAYVDAIPACGGVATVVCKGTLARKSLDQLDALIAADPAWWPAVYSRAMNHLHWPRALLHTDAAVADFRTLIELQREGQPRAYYARAWIGLGDALAKNGDFGGARAAWREGAQRFPGSPELEQRLALESAAAATAFVKRARNLEEQIDTDFTFLVEG